MLTIYNGGDLNKGDLIKYNYLMIYFKEGEVIPVVYKINKYFWNQHSSFVDIFKIFE